MMEGITDYRIWAFAGEVETFPVDTSLDEALGQIERPGPGGLLARRAQQAANVCTLLPVVVVTGLLDSVNPCAFAVILLLLAFLFTIRQSSGRIINLGGVYILMTFLVYLGIGLGPLGAGASATHPPAVWHIIMVALGAVMLIWVIQRRSAPGPECDCEPLWPYLAAPLKAVGQL